ncbi:MAG: hypothetical protein FWF32_00005, partial [Endomicrobia bacterium]|nr:hypothetical protein [Endomicrobiia bacterium]
MKFIKIFPVIFIFLTVISTVVFAATAPWGKAKFRNIGNVVTLGAPKVGSAVKTPYPTNRWFGSTYIYNRTSEEASYNPRASFKMAPRPLVFTTGNGLLDTNGQGYNLGFENFP